ncbi:MAG: Methanogen homoaconitase large subunit [Candidatus Methanofastidiosum methylothiophilum]|jgi:aconitate hydratase|uniref:Methanogen homoaconitase large subunit n=1 Tax=Candidatus Methanofastidiosum methylothiophilum TaxID=1705564 RepID=A0A150JHW0_9EURY|nr:MAG: Methanogen homoaconitase large subunit [Candidatus Methanofastidiosum methylthiophilus]MBP6932136.1 aconitate hydratase [Methanofastidiosum sp.]OQC51527.1 MAG: Methanogen homoaconitase large subunit [Euryarchaeota archaeon ADurb.Bin023]KYC56761.1 MAG: Methanogen homoaconitase large subunit [Candidatus Methanofastidiosum methylthiophilus]KYC57853.1 MAG: Methanogen homoaconitase large subunit [Candidatus Methanofastidiosum methylthiophilus]
MGYTISEKIISSHLIEGDMKNQSLIGIKIDQTLTQDATGTLAYLQFEAMGVPKVKTELSVSYVDHNTLQTSFENADDHMYLQSVAKKYGLVFSRPGNGICHQLHLERFGIPGKTLLGSDSHTPTGGGIGMISIGAGGLDVALAMAGEPFYLKMPNIVEVCLEGELPEWTSAKDIILDLLRRLSVKGGVNKIFEFTGKGIESLTVPERATITNMGTELGATTSIFPSDKITKAFMKSEGRSDQWKKIKADNGAEYSETIFIDLNELEPMIAKPHMPDNVVKINEIEGIKVSQVAIGSCTNSSYKDLALVSEALKGKTVHPDVSLVVSPGSKQVFSMMVKDGYLKNIVDAGGRILECTCGPCIGMGQAPTSKGTSLRTFNRNFKGRSGTKDADIYLVSPEVAVAAAIYGVITDPRKLGKYPKIKMPEKFEINDNMFIFPDEIKKDVEIIRGPNIKPVPRNEALKDPLKGSVLLKTGDNITTDDIMPAGAKILPLRSNIPKISEYTFERIDKDFPSRAKAKGGGFIIGGSNYGQGSSREHAAIAPMYLGIKAVIAKSFARIHQANLINFGIVPLTFSDERDYDRVDFGDELVIELGNFNNIICKNITKKEDYKLSKNLLTRDLELLKAGGALNYVYNKMRR